MAIKLRRYRNLEDFIRIGDFLIQTFEVEPTPNWPQARWEYMHFHPSLDLFNLQQIGIWEDDGQIVAVVHYEGSLGDAYFQLHPDYSHLKPQMLQYAEENLAEVRQDGQRHLRLFVNEFDAELQHLAQDRGYRCLTEKPQWTSLYPITDPVPTPNLPAGFRLQSLAEDSDLQKADRCLWRGFNHPGEPDGDLAGRKLMQSAPNWRPELNIVAVAPNGDYVSYSGIWYDATHRFAYVEPVATDPDYRRMGLGKAAVLECVRRCAELGATVAHVGSGQQFYQAIGFHKSWAQYIWEKQL